MIAFAIFGYLLLVVLAALIAGRKGRGAGPFFFKVVFGTIALELLVLWALAGTQDLGIGMMLLALACGAVGLLVATFSPSAKNRS
jgi:hypothetical protein